MNKEKKLIITSKSYASDEEIAAYNRLYDMFKRLPIPDKEVIANLGLFLNRASFSRMIFMHNIYREIINTPGIIVEFGVRWGQNMALFSTFRNMYEPYNLSRKIVGFDTFKGFPSVTDEDGTTEAAKVGALSVTKDYHHYLEELLLAHEQLAPRSNVKKFDLVKGDVTQTLPKYLNDHPETVIAMAYFDLTLYEPTKKCLELIKPHITKNSIIGFDELAFEEFPGETRALKDTWGLSKFRIYRNPETPQQSYLVFE